MRGGWGTGRWGHGRWGRNNITTVVVPPTPEYLGAEWALYVRDAAGRRMAMVDDYVLNAVSRFNDVGSWILTIASGTEVELLLRRSGAGLIAERAGQVFISGPVTSARRTRTDWTETAEISGVSDEVFLRDRLVYPEAPALTTTAAAYWAVDGVAETVMVQLVDVNLGPSAPLERRAVTLATAEARGAVVRDQFRFQTVLEALQRMAVNGGVGFRVSQDVVGQAPTFEVFMPADRRSTVVLSDERGTLGDYAATMTGPEANVVLVAGQGEGVARTFRTRTDGVSLLNYRRVEVFRDARDTDVLEILDARGDETLIESAEQTVVELSPLHTAGTTYGADYGLGDLVSAIAAGLLVTEVVRSVTVKVDHTGEELVPMLSSTGASTRVPFVSVQRDLAFRLTHLEKS